MHEVKLSDDDGVNVTRKISLRAIRKRKDLTIEFVCMYERTRETTTRVRRLEFQKKKKKKIHTPVILSGLTFLLLPHDVCSGKNLVRLSIASVPPGIISLKKMCSLFFRSYGRFWAPEPMTFSHGCFSTFPFASIVHAPVQTLIVSRTYANRRVSTGKPGKCFTLVPSSARLDSCSDPTVLRRSDGTTVQCRSRSVTSALDVFTFYPDFTLY